ncbi:MAG: DsbA family protein [Pseudomonadota bacterium]
MSDTKFLIIYDTYCGWCYGAAPVFDALVASGANVEVLHRHLFQGPLAVRMADGKGAHVLKADARIGELTGQEFSKKYTENVVLSDTEILESGYTAQAAALVHDQGPEKEFAIRNRLETARYIDGVSASNREAVVSALIAEGIPEEDAQKIGTPELAEKAKELSEKAEAAMMTVGAYGVPTVIKVEGDKFTQVDHSAFYGQPEKIRELAA